MFSTSEAGRVLASQDIFSKGATVDAVLRPGSISEVVAMVRDCAERGIAVLPRGGGMSYTRGYLASGAPAVALDLGALATIERVDDTDLSVVVQAGCTWQALHERLAPLGLRTPFWGTLSGRRATVGGTISQNGAFWGSATHGVSADSVLGLEVVAGTGEVIRTGALAQESAPAFFRHYGPDLTGLFTGDCGAFGVKTRIALRLEHVPPCARDLSFNLGGYRELLAAIAEVQQARGATTVFGFDPFLVNLRARRASLAEDFRALLGVARGARSTAAGLRSAASMAVAGRGFLDDAAFTLHAIVEAGSEAAADAAAASIRAIASRQAAREIEPTIPKVMRAVPFPALNGILGPNGERWVPVHCVAPHSLAATAMEVILDVILAHEADMATHGITTGTLFSTAGGGSVLIEPMFLWPDTLEALHRETVEPKVLARARLAPDAPAARAVVSSLRAAIIERTGALGAAHLQVGRTYPYAQHLTPATRSLATQLRHVLDPRGIMNPGVLGL
ncbi:MAG: FAD-binding oxidoreductase [Burkholderiales bacterium]|nr:FAD-binding oxidoreductase [Burkholderiales bacterium]